ncbi:MAG: helix-turn-helix domain-containing protein [Solirubrobacterales bacterium]
MPASDELRERFGINLRRCRERLGVSQEEVASRAESFQGSLWALEAGQKLPCIDTFIRLVGALETTPNELIAGIVWTPAEAIVTPGEFEASLRDPELEAEVAALRAAAPRRHRGKRAKKK